jgi:3-hydroxyisobutyrate dehydrogenase
MKIGFVGLGIMGLPMAGNLRRAGFDLAVWNRTASKCESLVADGAEQASSPADVARRADVVITIVSDTPDVEAVLFGPDGVFDGIGEGKVVIDMSTISPEATERFAARLAEKGADMLDAPVSGGESGAIEARLAIMVGGKKEVFERCRPLFEAMGKTIAYLGPSGSGQRCKLCNQIVGAINLLATAEGLRFAKAAGLDPAGAQAVVSKGAAGSWMLENLGPKMIAEDWRAGFFVKLQDKDLRLVCEALEQMGLKLPGAELVASLFSEATRRGLGDLGTQALIRVLD